MAGSHSVKFNDKTADAIRYVSKLTGDTLIDYTETTTSVTKKYAPVRKKRGGNHRRSINWKKSASNVGGTITGTKIFSTSNYGAYLEFGTSKMAARPHFSKAIREVAKEFQKKSKWSK